VKGGFTIFSLNGKRLVTNAHRKIKYLKLFAFIVLAIGAGLVTTCIGHFTRHRNLVSPEVANVRYIDSIGANLLFRGGLPDVGHPLRFNYNGLKKALINAGKSAGVKVPASFYLIDINVLNIENPIDAQRILVEQEFFRAKPTLGRIQVWGMNGTGLHVNAPSLSPNRAYLARNLDNWLNDRLASRIEILRGWLKSPATIFSANSNLPMVFYIHCAEGCDRTGEFSGAYYLRYLNKSWEEVNTLNRSMCRQHRPFGCSQYRALQWYCLWLNLERDFSLNWWKDLSCSRR
jgi:hypothetical protein